jgi:hypothetical protein
MFVCRCIIPVQVLEEFALGLMAKTYFLLCSVENLSFPKEFNLVVFRSIDFTTKWFFLLNNKNRFVGLIA